MKLSRCSERMEKKLLTVNSAIIVNSLFDATKIKQNSLFSKFNWCFREKISKYTIKNAIIAFI